MAYIQSQKKSSGSGTVHSDTIIGVTSGSTLFIFLRFATTTSAALGTVTVTDNKNAGNWTRVGSRFSPDADNQNQCDVFMRANVASGDTTVTATIGGTGVGAALFLAEYGGNLELDGTPAINEVGNNVTDHTSGSVTTTASGSIGIGVVCLDSGAGGTIAPNGGETERQDENSWLQYQDEVLGAAGNYTSVWTGLGGQDTASLFFAVKAVAGGSGSRNTIMMKGI